MRSGRLCACGCRRRVSDRAYWDNRAKRWRVPEYLNHHKGNPLIPLYAAKGGQASGQRRTWEKHFIDASALQAVLRGRGIGSTALADMMAVSRPTARHYLTTPRMRRTTAERILRALAGLPRQPSWAEQQRARRALEAERRRRYPRKGRAS